MDWFEKLTGFRELDYASTQRKLELVGNTLHSKVNGKSYGVGTLDLASLASLRERAENAGEFSGRFKVSIVRGNAREMHAAPETMGALFQVASQFNLLEMISPDVTPEHGVTRYQHDGTQGPACAMAAGAATIYRNYFCDVDGQLGQTKDHQLNGLADVGIALSSALGRPLHSLWNMQNGYAMCTLEGLDAISAYLRESSTEKVAELRNKLRIGVHSDVEVTDHTVVRPTLVSQAFCSALPVAYANGRVPTTHWAAFGALILEAAYEATIYAGVLNSQRTGCNVVFLTRLGGGAFGNESIWIDAAIRRALHLAEQFGLDVRLVSYGPPSPQILTLVGDFSS